MGEVLSTIRQSMLQIGSAYDDIQRANMAAIEDMMGEIADAMISLGFTESQEEEIRQICKRCLDRSNQIFIKGTAVNDEFGNLEQRLGSILRRG